MKTYEVFLKRAGKDPFAHAGSLDAPDDELALSYARDCYARRTEGSQMWVVARDDLLVADPTDLTMADRSHRHNDGAFLRELRQSTVSDAASSAGSAAASPPISSADAS